MEERDDPIPASEERLLDAVLGDEARRDAAREQLASAPRGALTLRLLEARLERAGAELRDDAGWTRARERARVQGILAATTRAERGSIGLGRSALRRWRAWGFGASAAAVLVVLPLLARRMREREDGTNPSAHRGSDAPLVSEPEPREAGMLSSIARLPASVQDVLARARDELAVTRVSSSGSLGAGRAVEPAAPVELRLLQARAKGLREHRWEPWLKELPLADLGTLALALWCEVQLDRYALTGELPPAWDRALAILEERSVEENRAEQSKKLLASALNRARDYGFFEEHAASPGLLGSLWTKDWFDDLAGAGTEVGLADEPLWRAWVVWQGGATDSL